jgi:pimeloyl-ACP methyl ester carboxylesterase
LSATRAFRALVFAAAVLAASLLTTPAAAQLDPCNPRGEPSPKERPLWWYRCAGGDAIVVFVHGGASDNLEEWQNTEALGFAGGRLAQKAFWVRSPLTGPGDYWPRQVAGDPRFAGASIAIAGYYTGFFTGLYGVDDAAEEWFAHLRTPHPATGRAILDYRRILVVGHSAGGVVARYVLAKYPEAFAGKRVALLLAASGGGGTKLLDEPPGSVVVALLLHRLGRQLQTGSDLLARVDACFVKVRNDDARGFELAAIELAETAPYGTAACDGAGVLGLTYVVTPDQALFHFRRGDPLTGLPSGPVDGIVDGARACFDHETLVRPTAARREPHERLAQFYVEAIVRRGEPAPGTARWQRLAPSTVSPDDQQAAMRAAGREAWARPLACE